MMMRKRRRMDLDFLSSTSLEPSKERGNGEFGPDGGMDEKVEILWGQNGAKECLRNHHSSYGCMDELKK
jgi:hypothetical protein